MVLEALAALSLPPALWLILRARSVYTREAAVFRPLRGPVLPPPACEELEGLRDVTFLAASGAAIKGWAVPTRNGAVIVMTHGSEADRSQLLPEARILGRHGYGVLLFDWPGHGESDGSVTWGKPECEALDAAIACAAGQPGVEPGRIGALGFSMGGVMLALVGARDRRVSAMVLEGTFAEATEHVRYEYGRRLGLLMQWPARLAARRAGFSIAAMRPVTAVPHIAPRPVLIVTGSDDWAVPSWMSRRVFEAAGDPKAFWVVPGAGHGRYIDHAPAEYADRLRRFFDEGLDRVHRFDATRDGPPESFM